MDLEAEEQKLEVETFQKKSYFQYPNSRRKLFMKEIVHQLR